MGLFNKKQKEEKRDLSQLPELPSPYQEEYSNQDSYPSFDEKNLPQLPSPEQNQNKEIKQALDYPPQENFEKSNFEPSPTQMSKELPPTKENTTERKKIIKHSNEPIFIRLDKFQETASSIEEIKHKIEEISSLLSRVKEIKEKEEKEIEEWERELELLKSRINSIDENIFSEVK